MTETKSHTVCQDSWLDVSFSDISYQHDIRPVVARTLVTYLELQRISRGRHAVLFELSVQTNSFVQRYSVSLQRRSPELFGRALQASAVKPRPGFALMSMKPARALGTARTRVVRALDYMGEQEMLEVKAGGVRHRYRVIKPCDDRQALTATLVDRMLGRETLEVERPASGRGSLAGR